jgi:SAM-dependent methyltransferase
MSLPAKWRRVVKNTLLFRMIEPLRFGVDFLRVPFIGKGQGRVRVLLASDDAIYTSEQQFAPLLASRRELRRRGILIQRQLVGDVLHWPKAMLSIYDVVGLKLSFRASEVEAMDVVRRIRDKLRPGTKLIYFDGDDDLGVQWPGVIKSVDLYLKKHCLKDRAAYLRSHIGKSNLTDYVARTFGISFAANSIPTSRPVPEDQLSKLNVGWNIGLDDKIREFYQKHGRRGLEHQKDLDVICRASIAKHSWIYPMRIVVIDQLAKLSGEFQVLTPAERVSQDEYYREMLRSRICVSPFGYGEICWRDFEAVLCGAVLVKPDMSHLETEPDIFRANETYVPVKWDYSDLESTLRTLLAEPAECERIRNAAFQVLDRYYCNQDVVARFERVVRCPSVLVEPTRSVST